MPVASSYRGALALVTLLLAILLFAARGLNLGVDFTGGMLIEAHHPEALASESIQATLVRAGFADASVKEYPSFLLIALPLNADVLAPHSSPHVVQQVIAALRTEQPLMEVARVEVVTPEVGEELLLIGFVPLIFACVAIMIHPAVRFGWRFAFSVAATNVQNLVIILGLLMSAYIVFEWEFSLPSLLAMDCLAILLTPVLPLRPPTAP